MYVLNYTEISLNNSILQDLLNHKLWHKSSTLYCLNGNDLIWLDFFRSVYERCFCFSESYPKLFWGKKLKMWAFPPEHNDWIWLIFVASLYTIA